MLYKLDSGIDHILVDEAQDTSKEQWEILKRLAEEFTSGKGAREPHRARSSRSATKNSRSIRFRAPRRKCLREMRREFAARHRRADLAFAEVPLHLSFRSSATVLEGVDKTFAVAQTWRGMAADEEKAPPHIAFRSALARPRRSLGADRGRRRDRPGRMADAGRRFLQAQDPAVQLASVSPASSRAGFRQIHWSACTTPRTARRAE